MAFGSIIQFDSKNRVEVKQRKELAQAIVENALEKVDALGVVILQNTSRNNSKVCKIVVCKDLLFYRHFSE